MSIARTPEQKARKRIRDARYREKNRGLCRLRSKIADYRAYQRFIGAFVAERVV